MTEKNTTVKPLFATVGATDAVYTAVLDAVTQVRERATDVNGRVDEARERFAGLPADVQTQFEQIRARLAELPSELPEDLAELREKFTPEELRKLAEQYYRQALGLYSDLAVRGEETMERLRANHLLDEQVGRVESLYKDASGRAEEVFDRVSGLIGRTGKASAATAPVVTTEAPAAPDVVDAEVVEPAPEPAPAPEPVKKAPAAKKTAAKKAPAKKATPKSV
ncbi:heparin-binding hemagglutinin [Nocardia flavorosea]|uniref:heparin-binding hemagglutinin n=1 Tax=Nocardia flavorosea TaxID=53429 RepID=UPI001892EA5B|nr:heparin-binding hemagglutinin [Nocardia flavorosea]MBF6352607.1 heparin-binding hemagglutinin [Nocardia flavorosea]